MEMPVAPVEVYCSFADADAPLLEQLEKHLSPLQHEGFITVRHRHQTFAGTDWKEAADRHLNTASLILLLVSPDFLAFSYCYEVEMQRAMQRYETNEAWVIPILLRPIEWQSEPFSKLQPLPANEKPVTTWRNRDEAFKEVAQGIKVALSDIQHLAPSSLLSGVWNVPYRRNPYFTGRDELLDRLDHQLSSEGQEHGIAMRRAALTQPQAIKGLGGIGKTQIAVEYAYRSRERDRYTHTFWVNAASEEALFTSFVALADLLPAFSAKGETDQRKLVEAIKRWLEQCQHRWLLIFDNADDIALVGPYFPKLGNGSILLTTRADAVGSLATSVAVETMGFVEGTHLLLRRAQRFEHASDEEINQAGNIVVALDHFPLALDQAGAYIEETQCSLADYLEVYRNHRNGLLARRGKQVVDYPDTVATTWSLAFQKVQQANPAAVELLQLCAFLAPDRIPEELIKEGAAHWPSLLKQAAPDHFTFHQMIEELLKFSLVKRLVEEHALSIHRLVQAVQIDTIEQDIQLLWAERVIKAVNDVFPPNVRDVTAWPRYLRYLDQVQACDALIERYRLVLAEAADVLNRAGIYLNYHALYSIAEPLYQRALAIREQRLGSDHPDIAISLNNLASLYKNLGKFTEAEPLYVRALSIDEEAYGSQHPEVATNLNNLALLYTSQGRYTEAEPLFQRSLTILEQQLGPDHLDTATPLNNLANLYKNQGKYMEAEPLYQRALAIREQQLGPHHPDTAISLNSLADLYEKQGKYMEAEPLYQRALAIREQQLEPHHPDTAFTLNDLASLYKNLGKYTEAESLYQRALAIREQQLGPHHPDTSSSLDSLAGLYEKQGKYMEAEPLYQRALASDEQQLGSHHPNTATSLNNLANVYADQGKYMEAEPLYQRALVIYEQQLGPHHPQTATSLNNLADLYVDQGKYTEAEPLYQRALTIREQQLGPRHLSTATSLNKLANVYIDQGKYMEAELLYQRALAIREQQLGAMHPHTASSLSSLATLYRVQGRYGEAEPLYQRALSIGEQQLGREHPTTQKFRENYCSLLRTMGRNAEAKQLEEGS